MPELTFADEAEPSRRRVNPWLLALVATSAAALLGGAGIIWRSATDLSFLSNGYYAGPGAGSSMTRVWATVLQALVSMGPPALITAGIIGLMLVFAVLALRMPRPSVEEPASASDRSGDGDDDA